MADKQVVGEVVNSEKVWIEQQPQELHWDVSRVGAPPSNAGRSCTGETAACQCDRGRALRSSPGSSFNPKALEERRVYTYPTCEVSSALLRSVGFWCY